MALTFGKWMDFSTVTETLWNLIDKSFILKKLTLNSLLLKTLSFKVVGDHEV